MPKVICRGQFLFEKSAQLIYVFNEAQVSGADHHVKGLWLNGSLTPDCGSRKKGQKQSQPTCAQRTFKDNHRWKKSDKQVGAV